MHVKTLMHDQYSVLVMQLETQELRWYGIIHMTSPCPYALYIDGQE